MLCHFLLWGLLQVSRSQLSSPGPACLALPWSPGVSPREARGSMLAQRRAGGPVLLGLIRAHSPPQARLHDIPPTPGPGHMDEGCRQRPRDCALLHTMPACDTSRLGRSPTLASLAWCYNHGAQGHGWLATGLLVEGRRRARARKPHFAQFAHPARPGKAVTILAAGSQEQKLRAWQEGQREGEMATFCQDKKGLAKALCSQPISHTSQSSFQLKNQGTSPA